MPASHSLNKSVRFVPLPLKSGGTPAPPEHGPRKGASTVGRKQLVYDETRKVWALAKQGKLVPVKKTAVKQDFLARLGVIGRDLASFKTRSLNGRRVIGDLQRRVAALRAQAPTLLKPNQAKPFLTPVIPGNKKKRNASYARRQLRRAAKRDLDSNVVPLVVPQPVAVVVPRAPVIERGTSPIPSEPIVRVETVYVDREVIVEKVVNIDVPVPGPVVEKVVEVQVEKVVEKIVEKIVEIPVEKRVEVFVDREVRVEVPVPAAPAAGPSTSADRPDGEVVAKKDSLVGERFYIPEGLRPGSNKLTSRIEYVMNPTYVDLKIDGWVFLRQAKGSSRVTSSGTITRMRFYSAWEALHNGDIDPSVVFGSLDSALLHVARLFICAPVD